MAFEPFQDFEIDPDTHSEWKALKKQDRRANLTHRYKYLSQQNPTKARDFLASVPQIEQAGWAVKPIPEEDFLYTIGYWYSWGYPEVMLFPRGRLSLQDLVPVLENIPAQFTGGPFEQAPDDDRLSERHGLLRSLVEKEAERLGLVIEQMGEPSEEMLDRFRYGYGWYFYAHFEDDISVPFLAVVLSEKKAEAPAFKVSSSEQEGGVTLLELAGELDARTWPLLEQAARETEPAPLMIDIDGLSNQPDQRDMSPWTEDIFPCLIRIMSDRRKRGLKLGVCCTNRFVNHTAKIMGMGHMFNGFGSRERVLAELAKPEN